MKAQITWREKMEFEALVRTHGLVMDVNTASGGTDKAASPKELLLVSICGCTGMDVVAFMKKTKPLSRLVVTAEAEVTKTHPKIFEHVVITFDAQGAPEQKAPLIEAVQKSQSIYCGVSAMVAKASPISYRIMLNGELVHTGDAKFPD
jgi:putative redox protein